MSQTMLPARTLAQLRRRLARNLAMKEAAAHALSIRLRRRAHMPAGQAAALEGAIRSQRVGILKQRAILGALGEA